MRVALKKFVRNIVQIPYEFYGVISALLEKLNGKDGRLWYRELIYFLNGEPCWIAGTTREVKKVLKYLGTATVEFASREALSNFTLNDRTGLCVMAEIEELLGYVVIPSDTTTITLKKHQLIGNTSEMAIIDDPTYGRMFKEAIEDGKNRLAQVMASLVLSQWNGEDGDLQTDGNVNLFQYECVDGSCFTLAIHRDGCRWHMNLWPFNARAWHAGVTIFSLD